MIQSNYKFWRPVWILVVILLLSAWLRWHHLSEARDMLMFDEAFNAWDALRLWENRTLTPFLTENSGRESGYHYWLIPFLKGIGSSPFAVRVASTMLGIATVAAMYPLATTLFNRHVGLWSSLSLGVLYWHTHQSQLGLRAITQPFIGSLAFTFFWRATQKNRQRDWIWAGLCTGALMYTYFSARVWITFVGLCLMWVVWRSPHQRRGAGITFITTTLIVLPQLLFTYFNSDNSLDRIRTVAIIQPTAIWENTRRWFGAWFQVGDGSTFLNLANRPILDPTLGILCAIGIITLLWQPTTRKRFAWLTILLLLSLLPSIISDSAPHFLRASGAVVPLALLIGAGASSLATIQQLQPYGWLLPLVLLTISTAGVINDQQRWIERGDRFITMEMPVNSSLRWIQSNLTDVENVYFSPYTLFHPNVALAAGQLQSQVEYVGAFTPDTCVVVPDGDAIYANMPPYMPDFAQHVGRWSELELLTQANETVDEGVPIYEIYAGRSLLDSRLASTETPATFIDALELHHTPIPATVQAGSTLPLSLAFRPTDQLPAVYSAFVHLHGEQSPYEGGSIMAQADSWLCESYQSPEWQPHETIIQKFDLSISAETPPGHYEIAVGVYESPAGSRIEVTHPGGNPNQYVVIGTIEVVE